MIPRLGGSPRPEEISTVEERNKLFWNTLLFALFWKQCRMGGEVRLRGLPKVTQCVAVETEVFDSESSLVLLYHPADSEYVSIDLQFYQKRRNVCFITDYKIMFFLPQYSRARVGKLWLLGLLRIFAGSLIIGNTSFESHLSQVLSQVKKNSILFIIKPILPKKTSLNNYNLNFIFKILFFLFIYKCLYISSILNFASWSTKPKMLSDPLWEKFANPYWTVLFVLLLHFTNLGERQWEWAINLRYVLILW